MRWRHIEEEQGPVTDRDALPRRPDRSYPRLNVARCVRNASPLASCDACSTACPEAAWSITHGVAQLDEAACNGCGLCHAACPEGAVDVPLHPALRENGKGSLTAFIACANGMCEEGIVPCIHALGFHDLKAFARQGVTRLVANDSGCVACSAPSRDSLDLTLSDFNIIQQSRSAPVIRLEHLPAEIWRKELRAHGKHAQMPDPGRRWFLGLAKTEPKPARSEEPRNVERHGWLYIAAPQIDPARCNGCDACVHLCPHDVFTLTAATAGLHYSLDPDQCTGCGLCKDICDQGAISLQRITMQRQRHVQLRSGQCLGCGAPFHMPRREGRQPDRCRICSSKGDRNRLFQVIMQ